MQQRFLQVFKNGSLWFEFPEENETNVRLDLMKQNLDRICEIKPKVDATKVLKPQVEEIDLNTPQTPKPAKGKK